MKAQMRGWLLPAMLWTGAVTAQTPPDAEASRVLACMRTNVPTQVRVQDVEFATADRTGTTSTLKGRLYAAREAVAGGALHVRAMLHLSAPPSLAGAAYLVREKDGDARDGMYVYLPGVKRVRRVTGSIADGGLMGTSFSYADFKQLQNTFGDVRVVSEGAAHIEGRPVKVLAFHATEAGVAEGGYRLVRSWIDDQTCLPLKAEFFEGETLRKRLQSKVDSLKRADGYWYASVVEMQDLKDQLRTTLRLFAVKLDPPIPDATFDPKTFYLR